MKKSSYFALVMGTVSGVMFSLGMCMALVLGIGLSLCLVLENYILGTVVGLVGIVMLLGFIPLVKGLK